MSLFSFLRSTNDVKLGWLGLKRGSRLWARLVGTIDLSQHGHGLFDVRLKIAPHDVEHFD